jgi:hypothetical protein
VTFGSCPTSVNKQRRGSFDSPPRYFDELLRYVDPDEPSAMLDGDHSDRACAAKRVQHYAIRRAASKHAWPRQRHWECRIVPLAYRLRRDAPH